MLKIFDRSGGPNPARIRIVVAAKGLEDQVQYVSIDLINAEQKTPGFMAKNPIGKIPVLELEDGTCLAESTAITEYLDNLDGKPILTGTSARDKGLIHMMQRHAEIMVLETVDDYFHYGTTGLGQALRPWRKPDWAGAREWGQRRGDEMVQHLPYFDLVLSSRPYLAGETFSMADISLFCGLAFADIVGLPVSSDLAALAKWRERVALEPCVENRSGKDVLDEDIARMTGSVQV